MSKKPAKPIEAAQERLFDFVMNVLKEYAVAFDRRDTEIRQIIDDVHAKLSPSAQGALVGKLNDTYPTVPTKMAHVFMTDVLSGDFFHPASPVDEQFAKCGTHTQWDGAADICGVAGKYVLPFGAGRPVAEINDPSVDDLYDEIRGRYKTGRQFDCLIDADRAEVLFDVCAALNEGVDDETDWDATALVGVRMLLAQAQAFEKQGLCGDYAAQERDDILDYSRYLEGRAYDVFCKIADQMDVFDEMSPALCCDIIDEVSLLTDLAKPESLLSDLCGKVLGTVWDKLTEQTLASIEENMDASHYEKVRETASDFTDFVALQIETRDGQIGQKNEGEPFNYKAALIAKEVFDVYAAFMAKFGPRETLGVYVDVALEHGAETGLGDHGWEYMGRQCHALCENREFAEVRKALAFIKDRAEWHYERLADDADIARENIRVFIEEYTAAVVRTEKDLMRADALRLSPYADQLLGHTALTPASPQDVDLQAVARDQKPAKPQWRDWESALKKVKQRFAVTP